MEPQPIFQDMQCSSGEQPVPIEYLGQSMPPVQKFPPSESLTIQSAPCVRPNPDALRTVWQANTIGRGSSYVPHLDPRARAEVQHAMPSAVRDDPRIWTPNLNDAILERQRAFSGEIWDSYKHMHARQAHQQFLQADVLKRRDKYARRINLKDGLAMEQAYLKQQMRQ